MMYKERYEQEINILGMNSPVFLISINENMRTILQRYKVNYRLLPTSIIPARLNKYIKAGIDFRKSVNCYTYKMIKISNFIMKIAQEMNIQITKCSLIKVKIPRELLVYA